MEDGKGLSGRSTTSYERNYNSFLRWCENQNVKVYSEKVFLRYFMEKAKSQKLSTLWTTYSMLKSMFIRKHNIDISGYKKLTPFIQQHGLEHSAKPYNYAFTKKQVFQFLEEAPNDTYLLWKVLLVFGIAGGCPPVELKNIMTHHIEDTDSILIIKVPVNKSGNMRTFLITERTFSTNKTNSIALYRKYLLLRPKHIKHDYLFISYSENKCTPKRVGIQTIEKIPAQIALFLNLENYNNYTSHVFCRTSALLLAKGDAGLEADNTTNCNESEF
ncbi:uncharacterized protein [Onthophagus taurus]|uniref:uncharacterized protein n=1 Tax=Onthophagus taurus TaxID=166361 RepID=UPI000C207566|nr:uncharacterized protein LOC111415380 [Onthophagus taurus]